MSVFRILVTLKISATGFCADLVAGSYPGKETHLREKQV